MDITSNVTKFEERLVIHATNKGVPLGGAFEVLPLCNMDCEMCFVRLSPEELKSQGRLRTVDEWLSIAREAKEAGTLFLLLTGGEPFSYPDFGRLYEELAKMGFILTLNTNGTLITEEYANLLAKHRPRRVNITLYGSSDEVYERLCKNPKGFTQTMKAIQLLKDRHIPVKLNGSVTRDNADDIDNLYRIAKELDLFLDVDSYMFPVSKGRYHGFCASARVTPKEAADMWLKSKRYELKEQDFAMWAKEMSDGYQSKNDFSGEEEKAEEMPCRAGRSAYWINWKGEMTPCVFMESPGISVFERGFNIAWEYIKDARHELCLPRACSLCWKRKFCSVCTAACLGEKKDDNGRPTYICQLTEEKMRLMDEVHRKNTEK